MLVLIKYPLDDELTQHVLSAAPPVWHGPDRASLTMQLRSGMGVF